MHMCPSPTLCKALSCTSGFIPSYAGNALARITSVGTSETRICPILHLTHYLLISGPFLCLRCQVALSTPFMVANSHHRHPLHPLHPLHILITLTLLQVSRPPLLTSTALVLMICMITTQTRTPCTMGMTSQAHTSQPSIPSTGRINAEHMKKESRATRNRSAPYRSRFHSYS